jgi:methylmalonyl-CoA/ethylmalonyl-CoA epimerase
MNPENFARTDPLGLGATLHQIGVVVRDLDKGMALYGGLLGLGPFMTMRPDYEARFRGWRGRIANHNAFAKWGDVYLEMVEPGIGQGVHRDWIETRGEGIFHLGFWVEDMANLPQGYDIAFESLDENGLPRVVMLDTVAQFGFYVEIAGRAMVDSLNSAIDRFAAEQ